MFIYPENLKAKARLWLWELRDVGIIGGILLFAVFILARSGSAILLIHFDIRSIVKSIFINASGETPTAPCISMHITAQTNARTSQNLCFEGYRSLSLSLITT